MALLTVEKRVMAFLLTPHRPPVTAKVLISKHYNKRTNRECGGKVQLYESAKEGQEKGTERERERDRGDK
jgi:hypothetical protein